MISLRSRLLVLIGLAEIVLVTIAFLLTYDKSRHEAEELLDGQLAISMRLIEAQIHHDQSFLRLASLDGASDLRQGASVSAIEEIGDADRGPYEPEIAFGVWNADGVPLLRSANALQMQQPVTEGFADLKIDNRAWRSYAKISDDGWYRIQVAHSIETRDHAGLEVAQRVTYPLILALPLLLLVIYYAIQVSLKPVRQLAREISQRSGTDSEPINTRGVIKELIPVIASFNQLLARVKQSSDNERRFTADAAHELRSPLAGLKIQAQVASATSDPATQRRALDNVLLAVRRSERLVEQLLRLSKLDPAHSDALQTQPVNLRYLILEALDATQSERVTRRQSVELETGETDVYIAGDHDLLLVMMTNLLSNAAKYSPDGTSVTVGLVSQPHSVALIFSDEGSGVPESELPDITKRFKRGRTTQGEGSGLGLAIVKRIVELHHGSLEFSNRVEGGFCVRVIFTPLVGSYRFN